MLARFRVKIPLIGESSKPAPKLPRYLDPSYSRSDWRKDTTAFWKLTDEFADVKPGRKLGAPYMDDFFAQRQSVSLCEDCFRKYGWKEICSKYNYKVITWVKELADCAGCGSKHVYCTGFWPIEHHTSWAYPTSQMEVF